MKTNQEFDVAVRIQGSLLRLRAGREIAIYVREGVPSVVEFRHGVGELFTASGWMIINGRKLVHAQRRGEVETVSPIPAAIAQRIEALHPTSVVDDARPSPLSPLPSGEGNVQRQMICQPFTEGSMGAGASDRNPASPGLAELTSRLAAQCAELCRRCFSRIGFSSGDSAA